MTILEIALGFALFFMTIFYLVARSKYKNLNKRVSGILNELHKPLRKGYYKVPLKTLKTTDKPSIPFTSIVYVNEIDSYTNGESKIKLYKIEPGVPETVCSFDTVETRLKGEFKSIVKTSDIEWLESKTSIKEARKNKLEQLQEIMKKS